jgi:molybdenum cofactor cytidylyltransferase
MPTFTKLAAVILAAGESARMGTDKALLALPQTSNGKTETFLSAAINGFTASCSDVLVVAGKNAAALDSLVRASSARLLINPDPSRGQFSSLQVGLHEVLERSCDATFISLVDCPVSSADVLFSLQRVFISADSSVWCVVPEYRGTHGHPYIAGRNMIDAFLQAPAASSAKEVKRQYDEHIQYLAVDDERVVLNINAPSDYARLCSLTPRSSAS